MNLFAKSLSVRLGAVALSSAVLMAGCKKEEPAPAPEAPAAAPAAEAPKPAEEAKPAEPAPAPAAPTPADPPAAPTPPAAPAAAPTPQDGPQHPALHDPSKATEKAPAKFTVTFKTTKGDIVIEVKKEWSPLGADRFYNLIKMGYFKDIAFSAWFPASWRSSVSMVTRRSITSGRTWASRMSRSSSPTRRAS
jgi:peptidyl-prolyl cis-trans isomerase A (cyclophilin A)